MTKKLAVALALAVVLAAAGRAEAKIATIDNVPAATLLLPYFEVDLSNPAGLTTLLSVNNASATAILAHVTLWTDLSVPTYVFNIYLTGYDVQTINLRDIFSFGNLPQTASAGQDPTDTISPKGQLSQDINFASCNGQLPAPQLGPSFAAELRAAHTGHAAATILSGNCGGLDHGDSKARGYVTVDTVNNCTLRKPGEAGYFGPGGTGDATNQNTLWGDYFIIDSQNNFAQGDALVHVEASATNPETSVAGQYTFYGRYTNTPWNADDNREPLSAKLAARFVNGGGFTGGSNLIVWRDSKVSQAAFACGNLPGWYPLAADDLYDFDEQEHPESLNALASPPFPAESARVRVNGPELPVSPDFGWLYLNLNRTGGTDPSEDPDAAQAWVGNVMDAEGRFSVGQSAAEIETAAATTHGCISTGTPPPCP